MSLLIYLIAFFVCIFNLFLTTKIKIKTKKGNIFVGFLGQVFKYCFVFYPVVFLYGFRYRVGVDYNAYLQFYRYIQASEKIPFFNSYMEPGYVFLNYLASRFFSEGYGIFIINGIVLFLLIYLIQQQYPRMNKPLSVYIFLMVYFGFSCNGIRQMLAVLVLLYGYNFLLEQKMKSYIGMVLIATLFHSSAIFFLVFILLEKLNAKHYKYMKIGAIILGFLVIVFQNQMLRLISAIGLYGGHISKQGAGLVRGLSFLAYVIPIIVIIEWFKRDLLEFNSRYELYILFIYLQIPLQCFGAFNAVMERMALYCSVLQVVILPLIVNAIQGKRRRYIAKVMCYAWYLLYFIVMEIYLGGNGIAEYQFWVS